MSLAYLYSSEMEGSFHALAQSFAMIIASEIGDKTFLIAAILAMRHPRLTVFLGAFSALFVMSILSVVVGHILPTLIPRKWTQVAAAVLFGVFGVKMWLEGRAMEGGSGKMQEEMKEAEEEIEDDEAEHNYVAPSLSSESQNLDAIPLESAEEGAPRSATLHHHHRNSSLSSGPKGKFASIREGARNFCSLMLGPVFVQAFVLTFLGEWGDRSQIATIALGAAHNPYLVTLGTVVGHACCTAMAVIGGRWVSTKISVKHVTLTGAVLFLVFCVFYLYEAFKMPTDVREMSLPLGQEDIA